MREKKHTMTLYRRKEVEEENTGYPTVGEMLEYIKNNNIPMDAEVVVECVENLESFPYYRCENSMDGVVRYLPVINGFGSVNAKKFFLLSMFY